MMERLYGGAQNINTSKDHLMASTFGTNHKKHNSWIEKYKSRRDKRDKDPIAPPAASKYGSIDKLAVSQHLKEVSCSKCMLYDTDAYKYWKKVCKSRDQA